MQFGFLPGCGAINASFSLRKLQEKNVANINNLYFPFADLKKT